MWCLKCTTFDFLVIKLGLAVLYVIKKIRICKTNFGPINDESCKI